MKFEQRDLLDTGPRVLAIADTEGTIYGAWRGPSLRDAGICAVDTPNVARGWAGFTVSIWLGETRQHLLYHAPVDELTASIEPVGVYPASASLPADNVFQNVRVSDTTIIAQVQPLGRIRVERESEGYWLAGASTPTPGSPQLVHVVGNHVLWLDWISSTGVRIAHEVQGRGEAVYHDPSDATITTLSTDGEVVVWTQTYGFISPGLFDARELWWAPYTRNADELEPKRVVSEFLTNTCIAGGGHCVSFAGVRHFDLYRLNDGQKFRYTVPGPVVSDAAWVADDHVAFQTAIDDENTLLLVPHADFTHID